MATHSSILAWKILWTEEQGGLQSMGSQKVWHDWVIKHTHGPLRQNSEILQHVKNLSFRFISQLVCEVVHEEVSDVVEYWDSKGPKWWIDKWQKGLGHLPSTRTVKHPLCWQAHLSLLYTFLVAKSYLASLSVQFGGTCHRITALQFVWSSRNLFPSKWFSTFIYSFVSQFCWDIIDEQRCISLRCTA